jgi:hypothetical protein
MVSVGSTSLSQSKTRYLRNLIEHCHGYLEEGCIPEQADLYMRLLFDAEDELRHLAFAASSAPTARIWTPTTIAKLMRTARAMAVDDRVEGSNSVNLDGHRPAQRFPQ